MRNLLALIGALVVGFGGLGWYLGWYKVHVAKAPDGNLRIETDVDTKKVGSDAQKLGQTIGEAVEKGTQNQKAAEAGPPVNMPGPVTAPQTGAQHDQGGWLFGPPVPKKPMGQ